MIDKDLLKDIPEPTDEELAAIEAEVDDFDLDENKIFYEIWIVGDTEDNVATDFELMIDDGYTELVEAKKVFEYASNPANLKQFLALNSIEIPEEVKHLYLRLEACTDNGDEVICGDIYQECEVKI